MGDFFSRLPNPFKRDRSRTTDSDSSSEPARGVPGPPESCLEVVTHEATPSPDPPANPGAEAFRSVFAKLVTAVESPSRLADELFERRLVPISMLGEMSPTGVSDYVKSRNLLISLQSRLETNPSDFDAIMSAFESSTALSPGAASRLRQAHNQLTGRDTVLAGAASPLQSSIGLETKGVVDHQPFDKAQALAMHDKLKTCFTSQAARLRNHLKAVYTDEMLPEFRYGFILELPCSIRDEHLKFFNSKSSEISKATTFDELFIHLDTYWDYLNYTLLEGFIDIRGTEEMQQDMEDYVKDLKYFRRKTTLSMFLQLERHKIRRKVPPGFSQLVTKHCIKWESTLEDIENLRLEVNDEFQFRIFTLFVIEIVEGSVIITWFVPSSVISLLKEGLRKPEVLAKLHIDSVKFFDEVVQSDAPVVQLSGPPATGGSMESPVYQAYAVYLKYLYFRTHKNKWPQDIITSYVPLATVLKPRISRDQANEFTRATLHHGIDEILGQKEATTMEDILKPLKGQAKVSCVLVEGPPGVGKSTFAWQLCQRWDDIPDLKKFSLVVLLRFRDKQVQEAKDIADLFFHDDASLQQAVAKEVCTRNGDGVLVIFDGFDELPASLRRRSLLLDIIKGFRIPGCTVVVTSRPSATADLFASCRVDKHIEVLGFTQQNIEEYASTAFASEPQLLVDFHRYRKVNPAIRSMMYIPLNTAIVADVILTARGKPLSHTVTQLYVEMIFVFLIRYLKENGDDELAAKLPTRLEDLPSDILSHLLKLGKMAFKGIVNEEVIFSELPTECDHFGFINASPELHIRRPAMSYNFLHRSIQELFTAFYISQLPPSEQKEVFHGYTMYDDRFKEVWRFVAGLTGFRGISWEEVELKSTRKELVSYLYEAQDVAACDSVLGEGEEDFEASSLFDCHAVGWCLAASRCSWRLDFAEMGSGAEVCETFASGVKSRKEVCGSVSALIIFATCIKEEGVIRLMELPSNIWHNMSELKVSICGLNASASEKVANFIQNHISSLETLDISFNEVGEGGLVRLFHTLSQHGCLNRLTIGENSMGCADVEALAHLIRPDGGRLKELEIDNNDETMSPECQIMLVETVLQPSSLDSLEMHYMDTLCMSCACDSFALLANNSNLTSITVVNIGPDLPSMLKGLENNKSLKKLRIVSLQSADVAALVKMLSINTYLEELIIRGVTVSRDNKREHQRNACLNIIRALQTNTTLKRLKLVWLTPNLFTKGEKDEMDSRVIFL